MANLEWTGENIPELDGKNIIVTGANSGIGYEATRRFAERGAHVVMACRSLDRGGDARRGIEEEVEDASLEVRKLDLADLSSVEDFAQEFQANHEELHVLCNNAGIMGVPREETGDGFEKHFGVNHLGHFALTYHLLDKLIETEGDTRIVTQSSSMHKQGSMEFKDLMMEENYDPWKAYARSKLANLLFAYQLDLKFRDRDIEVDSVACHPGYADTRLQTRAGDERGSRIMKYGASIANKIFAQSAGQGSLPMVYAAAHPDVEGGDYIGPGGLFNMRGKPEKQRSSSASYNMETAEELWERSEELAGVEFDI
jgi:NAD(P)-dependent dehydrogenase (short-subunit alcohol dehydrogenase family)